MSSAFGVFAATVPVTLLVFLILAMASREANGARDPARFRAVYSHTMMFVGLVLLVAGGVSVLNNAAELAFPVDGPAYPYGAGSDFLGANSDELVRDSVYSAAVLAAGFVLFRFHRKQADVEAGERTRRAYLLISCGAAALTGIAGSLWTARDLTAAIQGVGASQLSDFGYGTTVPDGLLYARTGVAVVLTLCMWGLFRIYWRAAQSPETSDGVGARELPEV